MSFWTTEYQPHGAEQGDFAAAQPPDGLHSSQGVPTLDTMPQAGNSQSSLLAPDSSGAWSFSAGELSTAGHAIHSQHAAALPQHFPAQQHISDSGVRFAQDSVQAYAGQASAALHNNGTTFVKSGFLHPC